MSLSRRRFLLAGGSAAGLAAWSLVPSGSAVGAPTGTGSGCVPPKATGYGPASLTGVTRGSTVLGNSIFLTSRYVMADGKLRLAEFDVDSHALVAVHDLDVGATSGGRDLATDGRYVYIGLAGGEHIWRYDPATGLASPWVPTGSALTWIYAMTVRDGYLYVGTYPDCAVRRYRLDDASGQTYGRVLSSKYATAVAVDDQNLYAASAAPGALLAWPLAGGDPRDLSRYLSESPVGVLAMVVQDGVLYVSSGRDVISMRTDGSGRVARPIAEEDRYVDYLTVAPDGTVYAIARLTSNVYRVTDTGLDPVATPLPGYEVENDHLGVLADGRLVGVSAFGNLWTVMPGGTAQVWQAADSSYSYPETVQSMLRHSSGAVWVGAHYAVTVHQPAQQTRQRFRITGEVKAMAEGPDRTVFAGLYPNAQLVAIDPTSHTVRPLGLLGHDQLRVKRMYVDEARNQLVVASGPETRGYTGALTFVDLATSNIDVHQEYLPKQSVMDVVLHDGVAYIVGDTYGEANSQPSGPVASVAAVDLGTRRLLWRRAIMPDWASYESVHVQGSLLYAIGRRPRGAWFAYHLGTHKVVMEGDLGGYGQVTGASGRVFTWVHWADDISELPTHLARPGVRTLYDSVPTGWYNDPMFSFEPGGKATWGMDGLELALFTLPRATGPQQTMPPIGPANGDFETTTRDGTIPHWSVRFGTAADFTMATAPDPHGTSLKVTDGSAQEPAGLISDRFRAQPGTTYTLTANILRESGTPSLYLYFYDDTGRQLTSQYQTFPFPTGDWNQATLTATSPNDAATAAILVYSPKSATSVYWIDEITLTPQPTATC